MHVPLQVSPESVQGGEEARQNAFLSCRLQDDFCCQPAQASQQLPVVTKQFPEFRRHGESDVLPLGIRQNGFLFLYPLVSELLATGGAEPALAAEADLLLVRTLQVAALEYGIAPHCQSTAEHFENVIHDGRAHAVLVLLEEAPPCSILAEQFFKPGWKAHDRLT